MVLEKTLESPLDCKEIQPVNKGNQSWIFIGRTDAEAETPLATWCEELTHWKRPWCWERLKAGGEGDDRGWDGWMASLIQWTWVWVNSGSWWWTERPGVLRSMGSQRVRHDWATELNWTELRSEEPNQSTCSLVLNGSLGMQVRLSWTGRSIRRRVAGQQNGRERGVRKTFSARRAKEKLVPSRDGWARYQLPLLHIPSSA